jgi:ribonucleoside-diphosphate reductase alpha chain
LGKAAKGVKPKVNFKQELQKELESVIDVSTQTKLEEMQQKVFQDRYSLKDEEGNKIEQHPEDMWRRVAAGIAQVEKGSKKQKEWAVKFYDVLKDFKFVPGGRILSGAGTPYDVTFYNCFVIPSPHDSRDGILDNLKVMVDIFSRSGGAGINLSSLRPRGSRVKKVNGWSSGPVNWASLYSTATHDVIQQGGTRRGALMLMINDWHPDVEEFVEVKKDLSRINGANLSICVSDAFMEAVKNDGDWDLVFPDITDPDYDKVWDGDIDKWKAAGRKVEVKNTVKAAKVWDNICQAAWQSAEPGIHFIDRSNDRGNTWYFEKLISTNPCGEQPLGAWAVCNLGSVSLPAFVEDGQMNYEKLGETVKVAIRFMDDVIDTTGYYFKENAAQQSAIRRVGLSGMGLGDALIKLKLRYGSAEAEPVVAKIYKTIRDASYEVSTQLATEKGAFPKFDKEKYMQGWFIKKLPKDIRENIKKNGIRNAVLLTQAPTGATSLLSGVSSGIEPVYDFALLRQDRIGKHVIYHRLYKEWMESHPGEEPPDYFVSANNLTPKEHIKVQAIIQEYTDSSISKTVNAPNAHTVEDVKKLYNLAYELGCKGVTYMRDGSREGVLSHATENKEQKEEVGSEVNGNGEAVNANIPTYLRKRTDYLQGVTRKVKTPVGPAFVTINADMDGNPFEVFINVGKAGSDITADAEALGRLMSLALRIPSSYPPKEVAQQIVDQLSGIGGASQRGFGPARVHSLADAVSKVIADHLNQQELQQRSEEVLGNGELRGNGKTEGNGKTISEPEIEKEQPSEEVKEPVETGKEPLSLKVEDRRRDICPKCGVASFVYEEGCKKCYSCAYSEC